MKFKLVTLTRLSYHVKELSQPKSLSCWMRHQNSFILLFNRQHSIYPICPSSLDDKTYNCKSSGVKLMRGIVIYTWRSTSSLLTTPSKYGVRISGMQFSLKLSTAEAAWACTKKWQLYTLLRIWVHNYSIEI
jgi:hypothetical protein